MASTELGRDFAQALAGKDFRRISDLLDPEVDFRGLTPGRTWEASSSQAVVEGVLPHWFEDSDEIERLVSVETDGFADRHRVAYRFDVRNPDGRFVVEQQAYYTQREDRIDWMRILCSGFRPR